jgi:ADP-ribosylglycohydrolase/predicted enzyme related to lactoylglutathione lyase
MPEKNEERHSHSTGCSRFKAEGAFIAFAAGDAIGWPQELPRKMIGKKSLGKPSTELRAWKRRGGGQYYPHEEIIQQGEYSDDTQLMLAVARSRNIAGNAWWNVFTRTELPLWSLYERGGGGATKRAVNSWIKGVSPWIGGDRDVSRYFQAGGNGVAMRVLPHALFYAGSEDPSQLIRDVIMDGVATHGHPRALIGATSYAYAAWWLLRTERTVGFGELVDVLLKGSDIWGTLPKKASPKNGWLEAANSNFRGGYESLWSQVVQEMIQLLELAQRGVSAGAIANDDELLRDIGCFGKSKGAGTVSTAAAVYLCARYAAQPVQAVIKAAFANGSDTDTIAAMAGGIVGCLAGNDWLPTEWYSIQDCDYLRHLANAVAQGPSAAMERPAKLRIVGKKEIDHLISTLVKGHKGDLDFDGLRTAKTVEMMSLEPLSKSTIAQAWQLQLHDGQTIYITKVGRKPKDDKNAAILPAKGVPSSEPHHHEIVAIPCGIKLSVDDLRKMTGFYEGILGMRPQRKTSRFVSFGSLSLVDAKYAMELSGNAIKLTENSGRHRIEIAVKDINIVYERIQREGYVVQSLTQMPWGQIVFHCTDPEGNVLEIVKEK